MDKPSDMNPRNAQIKEIEAMLPAIPSTRSIRNAAMLEIATRIGRGDGLEHGDKHTMRLYFALWLDKLLEAGVDVASVDHNGQNCIDLLQDGNSKPDRAAVSMVKRLIDNGFPAVASGSFSRDRRLGALGTNVLETALVHLAKRARKGKDHTDTQGNTALHTFCEHRAGFLSQYLAALHDGQYKPKLFDVSQNIPRNDGATPLHLLWGNVDSEDFVDVLTAWRATHLLVERLGGDLQSIDGAGRSVLDIIHDRARGGPDVTPTPGMDAIADQMHAKAMAMAMDSRTVKLPKGAGNPRL